MRKLTFFVITHDKNLFVHEQLWLKNVDIGNVGSNQLAESRMWFTNIVEKTNTEYVGFGSARWDNKWSGRTPLHQLNGLELQPLRIWAICKSEPHWADQSIRYHPGMEKYLHELCELTKLELGKPGLWANSFICHKGIYLLFKEFFHKVFDHFYKKHQYNYDYYTYPEWESRKAAFFFERVTTLYFSSLDHIEICQIP